MRIRTLTAAVLTGCVATTTAVAADLGENTTVGGVAFFDFSHISLQNENAAGSKVDTAPTGTGFDIKRFYLSVDHRFNDVWSADLTTDAQFTSAATTTVSTPGGGTATAVTNANTGNITTVMIKRLYLEGKFDNLFTIHIGSYNMPWDGFVEGLYGYRWVEKTSTDRMGFSNTTDWGLNATGTGGANGMFSYSASVVNGGGYKNPTRTKDVDFEGRVSVKPVAWLTAGLGFYTGHLGQVTAANQDFPSNTASRIDAAIGVNTNGFRIGGEWFQAKNYKTVSTISGAAFGSTAVVAGTLTPAACPTAAATAIGTALCEDKAEGISTWASYAWSPKWNAFGRYDDTKLSKDRAPDLKDTFFIAGIDFKPLRQLDFALVYKHDEVKNGNTSISGGDANTSYTLGGANGTTKGTYDEFGLFGQWQF